MNFLNRLDKAIAEQEQPLDVSRTDVVRTQKSLADFARAADKTSDSLEDLKNILMNSGLHENEIMKPFMEQLNMLSNGLQKGGELRKNFESMLSVTNMMGK